MANNNVSVSPDLASILATLSQFAQPAQANDHQSSVIPTNDTPNLLPPPDPRITSQSKSPQPQQPVIDPAAITDWSHGLRCVTKIAAQNPHFAEIINRMIKQQRKHEMQWYSSRQKLKQDQATRGTGAGELNTILKSIGGSVTDNGHNPQTQEEKDTELLEFDTKVYRAQVQMNDAMTAELKSLGVPFFGTLPECIRTTTSNDQMTDARPKWSPLISREAHRELQRRMITHLEDMYKD
ncbi:hypothetical protein MBLNU457_6071t1 [Dothideomycetes sp. NU457]